MNNIHNILLALELTIAFFGIAYNMVGFYREIGDNNKPLSDRPLPWIYSLLIIVYSVDGILYAAEGSLLWLIDILVISFWVFLILVGKKMKIEQKKRRLKLEQERQEYALKYGRSY